MARTTYGSPIPFHPKKVWVGVYRFDVIQFLRHTGFADFANIMGPKECAALPFPPSETTAFPLKAFSER